MSLRMDGWKVSYDGVRAKIIEGPSWAVVTYYRAYGGRDVPDSHCVESLHRDRPAFDKLIAKYQYPAPGSIKQFDFAYGRMASAAAYREGLSPAGTSEFEDEYKSDFVYSDAEDMPGVEGVSEGRGRIPDGAAEVRDLYIDWCNESPARRRPRLTGFRPARPCRVGRRSLTARSSNSNGGCTLAAPRALLKRCQSRQSPSCESSTSA